LAAPAGTGALAHVEVALQSSANAAMLASPEWNAL